MQDCPPSPPANQLHHHHHHHHHRPLHPSHQTCPDRRMPLSADHLPLLRLIIISKNLNCDTYWYLRWMYRLTAKLKNFFLSQEKSWTSKKCCCGAAQIWKLQSRVPQIISCREPFKKVWQKDIQRIISCVLDNFQSFGLLILKWKPFYNFLWLPVAVSANCWIPILPPESCLLNDGI